MTKQTVKLARGLSVSFSSEVVTQHSYVPCASDCNSCAEGCDSSAAKPSRTLTFHQLTYSVLHCESHQDTRTFPARYVVTEEDGLGEYVALRAFKDEQELMTWIATTGHDLTEVRTSFESRLTPLIQN